jgi:GMP synthase (glutamine-hydrolysing)
VKPVLCVRHEPLDTLGIARTVFEEEGIPVRVLDAWDPDMEWPALPDLSAVLALGGGMNADQVQEFPFLVRERELLWAAVAREVPVFGVCLGAQLLARALGELVVRAPARQIGFTPIYPTPEGRTDPVLSGLRPGDLEFHWNEDTCGLPPGATLLAVGEGDSVQAYRAGPKAWATLFHPEIDGPELEGWLAEAGEDVERVWGRTADSLRAEAARVLGAHQERGRELFRRFAWVVRNEVSGQD